MKRKILSFFKSTMSFNIDYFFFFFSKLNNVLYYFAALLLNFFLLFELISRVVMFFYLIKNIIYFIYLNQKKEFLIEKRNYIYSDLNVFYKIFTRPFYYSFLYTLFDVMSVDYKDLNVYLYFKLDVIERIFLNIANFVDFENNAINFDFENKKFLNEFKKLHKFYAFFNINLFSNYTFFKKLNKLSYIYSNNIFNLNLFFFLIDLDLSTLNDFLEIKIKETIIFIRTIFDQKCTPLLFSMYIGYYRTSTFSVVLMFNLYVKLLFKFISKSYKTNKNTFSKNLYFNWDIIKLKLYFVLSLFITEMILNQIDNIVNVLNDIKIIALTIIEDFTIADCIRYCFFLYKANINNKFNNFYMEANTDFYYIRKETQNMINDYYDYFLSSVFFLLYPYIRIDFIFAAIEMFFFFGSKIIISIFENTKLYVNFITELYLAVNYFLEIFYYFVTSSFYSEYFFILILIEFFLEIFNININSIEFIISLIFLIVSSIIISQFLDFFENYNMELLIESFSYFYFCFYFLYEQQKTLISILKLKLKSYRIIKNLNQYCSKFYDINKQNIKIIILLEKIKKIKIK